jgi:hypothetical protein
MENKFKLGNFDVRIPSEKDNISGVTSTKMVVDDIAVTSSVDTGNTPFSDFVVPHLVVNDAAELPVTINNNIVQEKLYQTPKGLLHKVKTNFVNYMLALSKISTLDSGNMEVLRGKSLA